jgi:hypothetical protein
MRRRGETAPAKRPPVGMRAVCPAGSMGEFKTSPGTLPVILHTSGKAMIPAWSSPTWAQPTPRHPRSRAEDPASRSDLIGEQPRGRASKKVPVLPGHSFVHRDGGCAASQDKDCGSWKALRASADLRIAGACSVLTFSAVIASPDLIRGSVPGIPMDGRRPVPLAISLGPRTLRLHPLPSSPGSCR